MTNPVLDAVLLVPIGAPCSGKHGIAEQMHEVGLVGRDGLIEAGGDETDIWSLVRSRVRRGERTLLLYSIRDDASLQRLLAGLSEFADDTCIIIMDTPLETIIHRFRGRPSKQDGLSEDAVIAVHTAIAEHHMEIYDYSTVVGSVLSLSIEGQDDW